MVTTTTNPFLGSHLDGGSSPEPGSRSRDVAVQPPGDELDDLFDYDPHIDDIFRDVDTNMDAPAALGKGSKSTVRSDVRNAAGLGIDEEVQITRRRRVNVKLDEDRCECTQLHFIYSSPQTANLISNFLVSLLSQAGIPKLRRIAKERLRFRGKGHEYSDAARILSLYQLWLDDLYPKAKFADALAMVEKLGHSKKIQIMRKAWIEGNTSRTIKNNLGSANSVDESESGSGIATGNAAQENISGVVPGNSSGQRTPPGMGDLGDLYSSPKAKGAVESMSKLNASNSGGLFFSDDEVPGDSAAKKSPDVVSGERVMPEEDELDALLNESAAVIGSETRIEEIDDEIEAMMEMNNVY
ncbi:hypothetical protein GP486_000317 [Trichoglossum hirsutum]|uniref:Chromosome segregation in meiosis protein n=1 Tax=Trichoglossum hirsutum TaxID=265104 RepID=A0A9P8LJ08_9PEZI|nr:hypothetical protein GP486_000317 [Trichoglossum hirsutum]